MDLLSLLDKPEKRQVTILQVLLSTPTPISLNQLAKSIHTDRHTTKEEVEKLKEALPLISPKLSLSILETPVYRIDFQYDYTVSLREMYYFFLKDALFFKLLIYLFNHKTFQVDELANRLLVSKATFFRKINQLNELLEEFHLKIKNLTLQGTEAQIRYFYYQLFWQGVPVEKNTIYKQDTSLDPLVSHLERVFGLTLSREERLKFQLWVFLTKIRLNVTRKKEVLYWDFVENEQVDSPLLKKLSQVLYRYFSRYALEWNDKESILFFYFIASSLQTSLLERKFNDALWGMRHYSPLAHQLGNNVLNKINDYLKWEEVSQEGQERLLYTLYQIHYRVLYFKGFIVIPEQNNWATEILDIPSLTKVAAQLAEMNARFVHQNETITYSFLYHQYLPTLWHLLNDYPITLKVGYFFNLDRTVSDLILETLHHRLQKLVKIEWFPYDNQHHLDALITNLSQEEFKTVKKENIFVLLGFQQEQDFKSLYDFLQKKIKQKLFELFS